MRPFAILTVAAVLVAGCDSLRLDGDTTFTGVVIDDATGAPLGGAVVTAGGVADTTEATGRFELVVPVDSTGQRVTVRTTATGYEPDAFVATADVGDVVDIGEVPLVRSAPTGGPGTGGGGVGTGAPGPATSLTLSGRTAESIGVTGAGAIETATLTFVAYDGQGRPVTSDFATDLTFAIASGPGGGETLDPTQARTGPDGSARVTLTSGTRAGAVQVVARGTVDGRTIESRPVTIVITGGLPDDDHFSIAVAQRNFAGYNVSGVTNGVTAYVGDKYGNPVQPGTVVYFTTDGGIIPGSAATSAQGTATVQLLSAAPRPSNAGVCSGADPRGYGVVTASTVDENEARIEDTATVLFSGLPQITDLTPSDFRIGPYSFTVSDQFGHPLAPGTTISVVADGVNIKATGDNQVTLGDFLCPGPGRTEFRFSIAKDNTEAGADDPVLESITITVSGPNGDARLTRTAAGRTRATQDVFERF